MKWGIVFSSTTWPDPRNAAAFAEIAEECGFESLWAPEHVLVPVEYQPLYDASDDGTLNRLGRRAGVPDPLIWFAYVAARTTTLRFGTGVVILPEHNTVEYAKTVATLAFMTEGRFMLGAGIGWCREEYEALDRPWDNRGARFEEMVAALRTIWSEDEPSFDGKYVKFPKIVSDPKPPGGAVPIVIGGNSTAPARRAGRIADGYFPAIFPTELVYEKLPQLLADVRAGAEEAGRDYSQIEITSGGVRTAEAAKWFADQGVHRLTIACRSKTIEDLREELARFRDEVIDQTRDL
jgi:probable F420-dependent oxidoreductase